MFILAASVLIVPLSKEGIIHSSNCILSPGFVNMIAVLGGIFTMIYTLKIYLTVSRASFSLKSRSCLSLFNKTLLETQLSFISPRLTITSIFIDQSLEYFLSYSLISSEIDFLLSSFLCSIDFYSNGILFSLFYTFYVPLISSEPL